MPSLIEQVTEHRNHIKHEAITFSLFELVNMYKAQPKEIEIRKGRIFKGFLDGRASNKAALLSHSFWRCPFLHFFSLKQQKARGISWTVCDVYPR
jgi:hypothetical protein